MLCVCACPDILWSAGVYVRNYRAVFSPGIRSVCPTCLLTKLHYIFVGQTCMHSLIIENLNLVQIMQGLETEAASNL